MIITIVVKLVFSVETQRDWERTIEIPHEITLECLHDYLQCVLDFDNDHDYEFYTANSPSGIKQVSHYYDSDEVMDKSLGELLESKLKKKLYYCYDLGSNWIFQISKTRKKSFEPVRNIRYPRVTDKTGSKLKQYGCW
jgi:hypothetical protein